MQPVTFTTQQPGTMTMNMTMKKPQRSVYNLRARLFAQLGLLLTLGLAVATQAVADWQLEPSPSSLSFVSIKNNVIAEAHTFTKLSGSVDQIGAAHIDIDLNSVETLIPIRNERMRELLLETDKFPVARVSAQLDMAPLLALEVEGMQVLDMPFSLTLHGIEITKSVKVRLIRLSSGAFQVSSVMPVMISSGDFGLDRGLEALREIANLQAITPVVPVSFSVVFRQASVE
jgi:polyisoprenoid-binding protein YceI